MAPRLAIILMASATDMKKLYMSVAGTRIKNPLVGLGVVGIKTLTVLSGP